MFLNSSEFFNNVDIRICFFFYRKITAFAIYRLNNREPQNHSKTSKEDTCLLQTSPHRRTFQLLDVVLGSCIMDKKIPHQVTKKIERSFSISSRFPTGFFAVSIKKTLLAFASMRGGKILMRTEALAVRTLSTGYLARRP